MSAMLGYVAYAAVGATYALLDPALLGPAGVVLKVAPILGLLVLSLRRRDFVLAAGVFASAVGDTLLGISDGLFVAGLAAFLVAQLLYIARFSRQRRFDRAAMGLAATVVGAGALVYGVLFPQLGPLALPVGVYLCAIVGMGVFAGAFAGDRRRLFLGAAFFVVSDTLIALDRFITPLPAAHTAIMLTYYVAQLAIVSAVLRSAR